MNTMRAKMIVIESTAHKANSADPTSKTISETLRMRAVCKEDGYGPDGKDDDNSFANWTPSADLTMQITNPDLFGKFKVSDKFYVDFTPA